MSKSKGAPQTQDVMPSIDSAELIARFQLETEAALATVRADHVRAFTELERKIAGVQDEWQQVRAEVRELRTTIEDALHQMRKGVEEAVNAQREAVRHSQKAMESAAVFDRLKASQPDFHRMVSEQSGKVAKVVDQLSHLEEQVRGLSRQIDEFEIVADDYQETKATVRGVDLIVKDLNAESKQRRRTGVTG